MIEGIGSFFTVLIEELSVSEIKNAIWKCTTFWERIGFGILIVSQIAIAVFTGGASLATVTAIWWISRGAQVIFCINSLIKWYSVCIDSLNPNPTIPKEDQSPNLIELEKVLDVLIGERGKG